MPVDGMTVRDLEAITGKEVVFLFLHASLIWCSNLCDQVCAGYKSFSMKEFWFFLKELGFD